METTIPVLPWVVGSDETVPVPPLVSMNVSCRKWRSCTSPVQLTWRFSQCCPENHSPDNELAVSRVAYLFLSGVFLPVLEWVQWVSVCSVRAL